MNKHPVSLITGGILLFIFVMILFAFQVRQTEVAVVTTFGRYSESSTKNNPGLYFRLPWPIQKVYKFDNRVQNFERKFEQTTTADARTLLVTIYIGWQIANPQIFLQRFDGDVTKAKQNLENLVRDAKNGVIGQHPFGDLFSTQEDQLKFDEIEREMLEAIQSKAKDNYGIDVTLVGIKQLGLPEAITGKVFERMREERQRLVKQYQGEGEARSIEIRAEADRQRREILAEAENRATIMMGQAEAEANKYYQEFEKAPELAVFLLQLKALAAATADKTTLILDPNTRPFNLLRGLDDDDSQAKGSKAAITLGNINDAMGKQLISLADASESQSEGKGTELDELESLVDEVISRVTAHLDRRAAAVSATAISETGDGPVAVGLLVEAETEGEAVVQE
ncbi:MAG: Modulator of FtsH protease HflC [Verrucomicrobia subdivision 3 bacterium]|nr:Modulator of FtsH protease HflC [Limisphaerales bacterium]MCS1412857.1 Modulator of FtsH protease HflC [Limisphaerales bacterium]